MHPQTKDEDVSQKQVTIPDWVKPTVFEELLKRIVKDYKATKSMRANAGVAAGENYATVMLRIELDVEKEDNTQTTKAFMLKTPHQSEQYRKVIEKTDIFDVERGMYVEVVPELEQLYRDVGLEVKFGAELYDIEASDYYVLLEDLRPRGFGNIDRLEGMDQAHTECVLKKFAQWHAASAVRVETKGPYQEKYTKGFLRNEEIVDAFINRSIKVFLDNVHLCKGYETYLNDLRIVSGKTFEIVESLNNPSPDEFIALNHGDGWANNIMSQYNTKGEIQDTYFVDLQVPKWGSVTQDLYYFLLSSTSLDIKTSKFDYFIWFYHSELVKHLKLLGYSKTLPTLRRINDALNKYSGWSFICTATILAYVLLDPVDGADFDKVLGDDDCSFKNSLYINPRFRKHMEVLLPWLQHRGAME
uniref:CHK kinase-like domain-containing protein n=1 Tax=Drosophila melanogaster TaxID=7227 RepID=Q9VBS4_DROME|nr:uncharacterized protein Dmel_CG10553 [Drosophila melanogaster]AAF56454.1 uncharacterized protein Dmel_CG10553 [Drosophila melanogaster]|eukprot:NP_651383.1 uncharacterized protein Dmel_CG10553 [Drosophila melanogaster]